MFAWTKTRAQRAESTTKCVSVAVDVDEVHRLSNTSEFEQDTYLVTRRGTAFSIALRSRSKLTVALAVLLHECSENQVALTIKEQCSQRSGTTLLVEVPSRAHIGVYRLVVSGAYDDGEPFEARLKKPEFLAVLFNAWCSEDDVYMEDEERRTEYVLSPRGLLYVGSLTGTPWNLALFRPESLLAVLFLLEERSELSFEERRSPVKVSREMSALVNWASAEDRGILLGCWDATGTFEGGRPPTSWRGSGEILAQYYRTRGKCVRYGQCWVFSGVLLTVLRVLGIPSRSVTTFRSAHDTGRNRTLDRYFDQNGEEVDYLSTGRDTVWNFHVWNEAWMTRPDLPRGFDGWQALDATPQELSEQGGGFRTGPAPLRAIKEGNCLPYDTNFVIAEVNADIKKYVLEDGVPRLFEVNTNLVGLNISTKAVGSDDREDITDQYKYTEGTVRERNALYHGYKELMETQKEVEFSVSDVKHEVGGDVNFRVMARSKTTEHRVRGCITCRATTYTGRVLREMGKVQVDRLIDKDKEEVIEVSIDSSIYSQFPGTQVYLHFDVLLAVHGQTQVFAKEIQVAPPAPEINVTVLPSLGLGTATKALVRFKNPFKTLMEDITLSIESDELLEKNIVHNVGSIGREEEFCYDVEVIGQKVGKHRLVVGLHSSTVELVTGTAEVEVTKTPLAIEQAMIEPQLAIKTVYSNLAANRTAHRTDQYEAFELIVRRGQPFALILVPERDLPSGSVIATKAIFQLQSLTEDTYMSAFEVETETTVNGSAIRVELKTPVKAAIGRYLVLLSLDYRGTVYKVHSNIRLTLLCNPWSPEDDCCYPDHDQLDEYVLNSSGRIWMGTYRNKQECPWQVSQFRKDSLEVAMDLVDLMNPKDRNDPVLITRHFSALVNSNEDEGVLMEWSGEYDSGTSPTSWTGSGEILAEYNRTKKPVRYGLSWVFSGVMTTLLRSIGIPCRSVTNYNCAFDADFNRSVDKFYDEKGTPLDTVDSIRSFHVWNEAWMDRPDLPAGFGGWQVLDATPQLESCQGGGYRLGPAPRKAVKLGQRMNYDVEFVISEVNADIRYYTIHDDGSQTLAAENTFYVGKDISTKAVGSHEREDLTLDYKYAEGTIAERDAHDNAAEEAPQRKVKTLEVELVVPDDVTIGDDFPVTVHVTNGSRERRDVEVQLHGRAMQYTGAMGQLIRSEKFSLELHGSEVKEVSMNVICPDYLCILESGNLMHFTVVASCKEEQLSVIQTEDARLKTPKVAIATPGEGLRLNHAASIQLSFQNPLGKRLTNGRFYLSGDGFLQDASAEVGPIRACSMAQAFLHTIPVRRGRFQLVAWFTSDQLADLSGDREVKVE